MGEDGRAVAAGCLISCSHWLPDGSCVVLVGRHGAMNPAGRVRCNIMPIAIGYSCVSQPFSLRASHALGYRRAVPHSILEAPARPGLSLLFVYRRTELILESFFLPQSSDGVAEVRGLGFPSPWVKHSPPKRLRNASAVAVSGKQNRI
jgi:hypothetical protein